MAVATLRRFALAGALALAVSGLSGRVLSAQKPDKDHPDDKRPKITLKAQPVIAMSPARVVLTAEVLGGPNDFEEFYCTTVQWEWGDGTQSESSGDCAPYEAGKSEIKRRFTVEHVFTTGSWHVNFRLKRGTRSVGVATVGIQIRPGLRDGH
jgi:hypothetical protein